MLVTGLKQRASLCSDCSLKRSAQRLVRPSCGRERGSRARPPNGKTWISNKVRGVSCRRGVRRCCCVLCGRSVSRVATPRSGITRAPGPGCSVACRGSRIVAPPYRSARCRCPGLPSPPPRPIGYALWSHYTRGPAGGGLEGNSCITPPERHTPNAFALPEFSSTLVTAVSIVLKKPPDANPIGGFFYARTTFPVPRQNTGNATHSISHDCEESRLLYLPNTRA